jgi:hypothetical protein
MSFSLCTDHPWFWSGSHFKTWMPGIKPRPGMAIQSNLILLYRSLAREPEQGRGVDGSARKADAP